MSRSVSTDGGEGTRDNKRFDADDTPFDASDFQVGDRIDPMLVASTMGGLGERYSADPDAPSTQLAQATITDQMDDVHTAILVDGETGVMVRGTRHDSQSALTQKEADWKAREIGTSVELTDVEWSNVDDDRDADDAQAWAHLVLGDRAAGYDGYDDEITVEGSGIELFDPYDNTCVTATIALIDE